MDTPDFNRINMSPSDNNSNKDNLAKPINGSLPYVDNTNLDLKSFDGGSGDENLPSGSTIRHTSKTNVEEKKSMIFEIIL